MWYAQRRWTSWASVGRTSPPLKTRPRESRPELALLFERYRRPVAVEFKDEKQTDPVTETDRAIERLVGGELRAAFPDHGILGEEGTSEALAGEYLWCSTRWTAPPTSRAICRTSRCRSPSFEMAYRSSAACSCRSAHASRPPCSAAPTETVPGWMASRCGSTPRLPPARPGRVSGRVPGRFRPPRELARGPGELRNFCSSCFKIATVASGGFQYAAFLAPEALGRRRRRATGQRGGRRRADLAGTILAAPRSLRPADARSIGRHADAARLGPTGARRPAGRDRTGRTRALSGQRPRAHPLALSPPVRPATVVAPAEPGPDEADQKSRRPDRTRRPSPAGAKSTPCSSSRPYSSRWRWGT